MKINRKILFIICMYSPLLLFCQIDITTAKAYRNYADFTNDKPLYKTNFRYTQKESAKYNGAYKVKSDYLVITSNEMKYNIWIISDGEYLYLNGTRQGLLDGYIKLKKGSNYYYFLAEPRLSMDQQERLNNSSYLFGAVGATITASKIDIENSQKIHHVFNLEEGKTDLLTKEYIQDLLADYPVLLKEFNGIENNDDIDILKAYLEIINGLK